MALDLKKNYLLRNSVLHENWNNSLLKITIKIKKIIKDNVRIQELKMLKIS